MAAGEPKRAAFQMSGGEYEKCALSCLYTHLLAMRLGFSAAIGRYLYSRLSIVCDWYAQWLNEE